MESNLVRRRGVVRGRLRKKAYWLVTLTPFLLLEVVKRDSVLE